MMAAYYDPATQRLVLLPTGSGHMPAVAPSASQPGPTGALPALTRSIDVPAPAQGLPLAHDYFLPQVGTGHMQPLGGFNMALNPSFYQPPVEPGAGESDTLAAPLRKRSAPSTESDEDLNHDGGCSDPKEKNRQAQRRFRARQKVLISGLKDDIEKMTTQAIRAEVTITNLRNEVKALRQQLAQPVQTGGVWPTIYNPNNNAGGEPTTYHIQMPASNVDPTAINTLALSTDRVDSNTPSDFTQVPISMGAYMQQYSLQQANGAHQPVFFCQPGSMANPMGSNA